jgi:hypothetical protein
MFPDQDDPESASAFLYTGLIRYLNTGRYKNQDQHPVADLERRGLI